MLCRGHAVDTTCMTYTCCGRRRAQIDIHQGDSVLSFTLCRACEGSSWLRDGQPTELLAQVDVGVALTQKIDAFV
jgi:hypothetical protein